MALIVFHYICNCIWHIFKAKAFVEVKSTLCRRYDIFPFIFYYQQVKKTHVNWFLLSFYKSVYDTSVTFEIASVYVTSVAFEITLVFVYRTLKFCRCFWLPIRCLLLCPIETSLILLCSNFGDFMVYQEQKKKKNIFDFQIFVQKTIKFCRCFLSPIRCSSK